MNLLVMPAGWIDDLYGQKASSAAPEGFYSITLDGALDHLEHGITSAYDFSFGSSTWDHCEGAECDKQQFKRELRPSMRVN